MKYVPKGLGNRLLFDKGLSTIYVNPHSFTFSLSQSRSFCDGWQYFEEGRHSYHSGRSHPVHIGDIFQCRYKFLRKLGYGRYSTVWLVKDQRRACDAAITMHWKPSAQIVTVDLTTYSIWKSSNGYATPIQDTHTFPRWLIHLNILVPEIAMYVLCWNWQDFMLCFLNARFQVTSFNASPSNFPCSRLRALVGSYSHRLLGNNPNCLN